MQSKPMDWFLYDNGLRHERVNRITPVAALNKKIPVAVSYLNSPRVESATLKKRALSLVFYIEF